MEQHGKNPKQLVFAIIPARYQSTRLEGKLLLQIDGKPLILHTLEQAKKAKNIDCVIVATDNEKILEVVCENGHEAVLTSESHQSGSDRIAEVAKNLPEHSIIVNVQGDEPLIPPSTIEKAVEVLLKDETVQMSTTCEKIEDFRDVLSPDVVKVVTDENDFALYFSRSPIPFPRDSVKKYGTLELALQTQPELLKSFRKHTGLYVFRREFLLQYTEMPQTILEKSEMLEQLRALENGVKIKVVEVEESSIGVDTQEDFEKVRKLSEGKVDKIAIENINYRWAIIDDLPNIAKVFVLTTKQSFDKILPQNYLNGLSIEKEIKELWKSFLKDNKKTLVALNSNNQIVGYIEFEAFENNDLFHTRINSLYVLPKYQRKGIGKNLFAEVLKEINLSEGESVILQALESSPFNRFYEKLCGRIVGFSSVEIAGEERKTFVYSWKDLKSHK